MPLIDGSGNGVYLIDPETGLPVDPASDGALQSIIALLQGSIGPVEKQDADAGRMFVAPASGTFGTTEANMLTLVNPANSGVNVYLVGAEPSVYATVDHRVFFRFYWNATVGGTVGTSVPQVNLGGGAETSGAMSYAGGTHSGGVLINTRIAVSTSDSGCGCKFNYAAKIRPGKAFRCTAQANGNNRLAFLSLKFAVRPVV